MAPNENGRCIYKSKPKLGTRPLITAMFEPDVNWLNAVLQLKCGSKHAAISEAPGARSICYTGQ